MKKHFSLLLGLTVLASSLTCNARSLLFKTQQEANEWLEIALRHDPRDVYSSGYGPYSDTALGHAQDALSALKNKANPNGIWENTGKAYIVGLCAEFTELLLKYGAYPCHEAIQHAQKHSNHDTLALLLAAQKRLQRK